ncbi:hypothetical protein [Flavobacterium rhizosphaerae]|uniref:Hydrolase n=1 Tax=Flavobacterium rhizosphaerae TaxID=3163298 RepID=A0ABW8YSZ0_9FLAO
MKKNIYLYLFIFSLLINIFTYVYFTKKDAFTTNTITKLQEKQQVLKDSLFTTNYNLKNSDYFSLEHDPDAIAYFETADIQPIAIKIRDGIFAKNIEPNGNPLVQYPPMEGKPFTISKIKILNNRWVIADFYNGTRRGQALIRYFIEENGTVTYETMETTLYKFIPY